MKMIRPTTVLDTGAHTRASTATYFDAAGVMQTAAINTLRINYNPTTLECLGALVEPAATNRLVHSCGYDNAAWGKNFITVTPNDAAVVAPDGTTTADKFESTGADSSALQFVNIGAGISFAYNIWLRADVPFSLDLFTAYDLSGFLGGFSDVVVANITNDWQRFEVTGVTPVSNTGMSVYIGGFSTFTTGETMHVWNSQLEDGTFGTSDIITTTAAITRAADVITGKGLIYSSLTEADFGLYASGTTYALGAKCIRTTSTTHRIYESLTAGNINHTPETSPTYWLDTGPTNKWGMFDQQVATATTASDSITVVLAPGRFNSLALLAVDASVVRVQLMVGGQVVYNASVDLDSGVAVGDWYQYFYEPVYQTDAVVLTDLVDAALLDVPIYGEGTLTVTVERIGGTVALGVLVVGLYADLGLTQYQPTVGITDYSRKDFDAFGRPDIVVRRYSKRMAAKMVLDNDKVDNTSRVLAQYRATPLVFVGADNLYTSLIVYGFIKDWEINIENYSQSALSLSVEGLT